MDAEFAKYLIGQGAFGLVAGLLFHFYRRDVSRFTDLWRGQSDALIAVVKENTASNVHLITLIDALHRRLDADSPSTRRFPRDS